MRWPWVFMYHSVDFCDQDPYRITISPARLDEQLGWLRRRGARGVAVRELRQARSAGKADHLVGLTFDDGYVDFVRNALPLLERHRFTATVFVVAGRLGGRNDWDPDGPRKPLLTACQVREVAAAGMEIGCHGWWHVPLSKSTAQQADQEIAHSRRLLREVSGQDVQGFCYPYGDVSGSAVHRVRAAGYRYACATRPPVGPGPYALPRTYIGQADSSPRLWAKALRHAFSTPPWSR
ncbi:polysaccharide deacetylase family protein [Amycolatopsis benzoatilytica]|uniref:polysaccharide deacetylase family protein n=1 Tax=Amycolatopsis benzoatilytica TaxID=346045 RepID=UPI00037E6E73|nr:polysaccharide deacetylase family protein [Amycolatopsis benzoatilytica]